MSSFVPSHVNQLCAISLRVSARFSIRLMICVADNEVPVWTPRVCFNCFPLACYGLATRTVIIACLCDFRVVQIIVFVL